MTFANLGLHFYRKSYIIFYLDLFLQEARCLRVNPMPSRFSWTVSWRTPAGHGRLQTGHPPGGELCLPPCDVPLLALFR